MAEITVLESKLGECMGLAMAAQTATEKVKRLANGERELVRVLDQMNKEAAQTERRCKEAAESMDGRKTAIAQKARETKKEAGEMMSAYLGRGSDALDGFEFLTMAEAGELGHWEILEVLAKRAGERRVAALAREIKAIQKKHVELTRRGSLQLAESEDPNEPA